MSKFIVLPVYNTFNTKPYIGYDEDYREIDLAIPIDQIKEIIDKSKTGKLMDFNFPDLDKRKYEGGTSTKIIMKDGTVHDSYYRTSELVKMINEILVDKSKVTNII
jgi:hypothetical protein